MDTHVLISQYQAHLVDALAARIVATEAAVGDVFAFEILRRGITTLVVARNWPHVPHHVPFHRIYNYTGAEAEGTDSLLAYCIANQIDVIVETAMLPQRHVELVLHQHQFLPQWSIPWLHIELSQFTPSTYSQVNIRYVASAEMDTFATLFVQGYGYHAAHAAAWHTFARHGYTAPGFYCFVADINHTVAGFGVLHVNGTTALIDGAATLPQFQGLGIQKALLTARMESAREHGCTHAFSRTGAGSISQQNMEKLGLREVYRTIAWRKSID